MPLLRCTCAVLPSCSALADALACLGSHAWWRLKTPVDTRLSSAAADMGIARVFKSQDSARTGDTHTWTSTRNITQSHQHPHPHSSVTHWLAHVCCLASLPLRLHIGLPPQRGLSSLASPPPEPHLDVHRAAESPMHPRARQLQLLAMFFEFSLCLRVQLLMDKRGAAAHGNTGGELELGRAISCIAALTWQTTCATHSTPSACNRDRSCTWRTATCFN